MGGPVMIVNGPPPVVNRRVSFQGLAKTPQGPVTLLNEHKG